MAPRFSAFVNLLLLSLLLSFSASAQGVSPNVIRNNATGTRPALGPNGPAVISPAALDFGKQFTGEPSAARAVSLKNIGFFALYQSSFAMSGVNAADFAVTTTCGTFLPSGSFCSLSVVFTPSALGWETAALTFTDTDSFSAVPYTQTITLTGTSVPPAVPATRSLNLTSLFNGGPSAAETIPLNNAGLDPLNQGSFLLSGPNTADFTLTTTCGTTFTAAAACSVSVLFTPAGANNETATLTFTDSDTATGIPYAQSVSLLGSPAPALPTGVLAIIGKQSGKALDVLDASTANGAPIRQYDFLAQSAQQWQLVAVESGYYKIQNLASGKVLDVILASTENGAGVQQWTYLGTDNQKWQLTQLSDGSFQILNKASGKLLDVTGLSTQNQAPMQQWANTGGDNQKWILTPQLYFTVTSLNSGKVLDVTGYSLQDGGVIQQWQPLSGENQLWQFVPLGNGYYEIVNKLSGKALEAMNPIGSSVTDGTLVQQYTYSGRDNQQWQLVPTGAGYYKIANKISGRVLDVTGISTSNGAAIQVYTYLGGNNQLWRLDSVPQ